MKLRYLREEIGLTQLQLAEMVGADKADVSAVETGKQAEPAEWRPTLVTALRVRSNMVADSAPDVREPIEDEAGA